MDYKCEKKILIIILMIILFILSSCVFNPNNNNGYFTESIEHKLIFSKLIYTEDLYKPWGHGNVLFFDGNYFYFSAQSYGSSTYEIASIMKLDLEGNIIWNSKIQNDQNDKLVRDVKKINNKLYIITSDEGLISRDYQFHIMNADTGEYYGTYYFEKHSDYCCYLSTDEYNGIIYFPIEYCVGETSNGNNIWDLHILCFDANSSTPKLIYERAYENFPSMFTYGTSFIDNGKIYLRFNKKYLFILDCEKVVNSIYTDEECIIKEFNTSKSGAGPVNVLRVNNKVITCYMDDNDNKRFICFDENNNYNILWISDNLVYMDNMAYPSYVDMITIGNKFIFPRFVNHVSCYSLDNGKEI